MRRRLQGRPTKRSGFRPLPEVLIRYHPGNIGVDDLGIIAAALVAVTVGGCAASSASSENGTSPANERGESSRSTPESPRPETSRNRARPAEEWVDKRVRDARRRLEESRAGTLVWKSIEHHGGLERWYRSGPLSFHYNYQPLGDRTPRNTHQVVDTWSARARHQMANNRDREYGWDGKVAWYRPSDWKPPYDVRFWALTPYYFVGMPFVLADPGVRLEYEGTGQIEGDDYHVVRASFGEVGISPDDYYVLYIDTETHRLGALRYIVSYPEYFPEGGHSPEKLMTYDGRRRVDGILFAEKYRFYMWDPEAKTDGKKVTVATLDDVEFRPDTPDSYFDVPEGAESVEKR